MSRLYRIQEFAALAGVTVKALRHYERIGLLKPSRTSSGYRTYTYTDLERLEQIVALKFLGFPLQQMMSYERFLRAADFIDRAAACAR